MKPSRPFAAVPPAALAALVPAFLGLGACAPVLESTVDRVSADKPVVAENLAVSPRLRERPPRLVAVLGVENATPDPEAAEIVRRLFYGNFSALPFRDVELGRADGALASAPEAAQAELAQRLGADAYVRGRVHRFERNYYGVYADLVADLEFELVEAGSGQVLWRARADETRRNVSLSLSASFTGSVPIRVGSRSG